MRDSLIISSVNILISPVKVISRGFLRPFPLQKLSFLLFILKSALFLIDFRY